MRNDRSRDCSTRPQSQRIVFSLNARPLIPYLPILDKIGRSVYYGVQPHVPRQYIPPANVVDAMRNSPSGLLPLPEMMVFPPFRMSTLAAFLHEHTTFGGRPYTATHHVPIISILDSGVLGNNVSIGSGYLPAMGAFLHPILDFRLSIIRSCPRS